MTTNRRVIISSLRDVEILGASAKCIVLGYKGTTGFMRNTIFNKMVKNLNKGIEVEIQTMEIPMEEGGIMTMWGLKTIEF